MSDVIDSSARDLQRRVNEEIRSSCLGRSALRWKTIAEEVVGRLVDSQSWNYLWADTLGQPPQIAITGYSGR